MTLYKIRNPQGLYSTGGSAPSWSKRGKTWVALNHLNAHLTLVRSEQARWVAALKDIRTAQRYEMMRRNSRVDKTQFPYVDCDIVEYHTTEASVRKIVS